MRLPVPLRRRNVLWLLLPSLPLLLLVAAQSHSAAPVRGYWTSTVAHSVLLFLVPAGLSGTGAALEASRLRAFTSSNRLNLRRAPAVLADAIWPTYVCGLFVQGLAIAVSAIDAPGGGSHFPVGIATAMAAMLLFHAAAGFMFGSLLRPTLSIPLALVFSYSWLGFTGTISWAPLRHLSGLVIETCCALDEQVSSASLLAVTLFSLTASAGALIVSATALNLTAMRASAGCATGTVVIACAVCLGLAAARNLGYEASSPRPSAELRCFAGEIKVCLYPEQLLEDDVRPEVEDMLGRVKSAGVPVPTQVLAGDGTSTDAELLFRYEPGRTRAEVATSLASSFQGESELRCAEPAARTIERADDAALARSWLRSVMLEPASLRGDLDPFGADLDDLQRLRRVGPSAQALWVKNALAAMHSCLPDPEPLK